MRRFALGLPESEHLAHARPLLDNLYVKIERLERNFDCKAVGPLATAVYTAGKVSGHLTGLPSIEARNLRRELERANTRIHGLTQRFEKQCRRK